MAKINLSGWYNGIITLEDKVIDIGRREIRPKATEKALEGYYNECVKRLGNYPHYFADQNAFHKTKEEVMNSKRARLVARDSVYPNFFDITHFSKSLDYMLNPDKPRKKEKYFYVGRCLMSIPLTESSPFVKLVDTSSKNVIKALKEDYEPRIEIPNDRTQTETKATTMHETLHYVITNYQINSERLFTSDEPNHTKRDRHIAEHWIQEMVVEELTDLLLEDDKEALFEHRWGVYEIANPQVKMLLGISAAIPTGLLIGSSIGNPKLLPLAILPTIAKSFLYDKYKISKKEELTKPIKRKDFKI